MTDRHQGAGRQVFRSVETPVFYYVTGIRGSEDEQSQTNAIKRFLYHRKKNRIGRATRFSDRQALDDHDARPQGLVSLLLTVQEATRSTVAVAHVARLSTDRVTRAVLLTLLDQLGCQVVDISAEAERDQKRDASAKRAIGDSDEFAIQTRVKAWRTFLRLRAGRLRKRAATGRCEGGKPFGSLPDERRTLRRIMELARKPRNGMRRSSQDIAGVLNAEGLRTRNQRCWTRWTVYNLLRRLRQSRRRRKRKSNA